MKAENKFILVVDDDSDSRAIVKRILTSQGFEVEESACGAEALEKLKTLTPCLVILDIMMPGMNGFEVVEQMKKEPNTMNIPVMIRTGRGEPEDIITSYQQNFIEHYITKPFTIRELVSGVKLVLSLV
jgi:DNA-binding response OmpR family regulator